MTRSLHQTEDRPELERRYHLLAQILLAARDRMTSCDRADCPTCSHIAAPVDIPDSVINDGHEPREDLEQAVEAIGNRIAAVAMHIAADGCPAAAWLAAVVGETESRRQGEAA